MMLCYRALTAANDSIEQRSTDLLSNVGSKSSSKIATWAQKQRELLKALVVSSEFENVLLVLILFNTLCLAVVHYDQPDVMTNILELLEIIFTALFVLEAVMKIVGLGFDYFRDKANVFDFFVTSLSCLSLLDFSGGGFSALRSMRVFRGLRVARVLRQFPVVMR